MREETKAVKKLLCELWTNNKFYIRFKKGQFAAISEREIEPKIMLPKTSEIIDLNMVEFIEVS